VVFARPTPPLAGHGVLLPAGREPIRARSGESRERIAAPINESSESNIGLSAARERNRVHVTREARRRSAPLGPIAHENLGTLWGR
jgi:hypothetical protein